MQIVIEISEEYYNDICNSETVSSYSVLYALDGIGNGTPLPKGHGKIVDVNDINKILRPIEKGDDECAVTFKTAIRLIHEALNRMPTIIEADKAESEDSRCMQMKSKN